MIERGDDGIVRDVPDGADHTHTCEDVRIEYENGVTVGTYSMCIGVRSIMNREGVESAMRQIEDIIKLLEPKIPAQLVIELQQIADEG